MADSTTRCDRCGDYFLPGRPYLEHRAACQERPGDPNPPAKTSRPCRACARALTFAPSAKNPTKTVPLETLDSYTIDEHGRAVKGAKVYVNHYQTCPNANDFHRRG